MSTKSTVSLHGKSAKEMRELIDAKAVTAKAVVEYLQSRESLRFPSRQLLAELTGESEPKAPAKTPAKPVTATPTKRLYGAAKAKHEEKLAKAGSATKSPGIPATRMEALGEMALRIAELAKMWGELTD
jgi:hypothetical protein